MRRIILMALLCSLICTSAFAGSVTGTVKYDGSVPKLRPYDMNADPDCAKKHTTGAANQMLVLGDGNTLGNIFVQVKNPPAGTHTAPSESVTIDQNGCLYTPRVVGVMAGQPVTFKNSDGILHNVHGLPKVNREFNIGMPPSLKESEQTFNKPEPLFKVKCDVHPWMNSYIAVMTHPYFAVTDTTGTFEIDGIADGTYDVEAWHEKLGTQNGKVTVSGGGGTVDFTFAPPAKK